MITERIGRDIMAKKKTTNSTALEVSEPTRLPSPVDHTPPKSGSKFAAATGSENSSAQTQLMVGVLGVTGLSTDADTAQKQIAGAVAILEGIRPKDELEGMLATQMWGTHQAAMNCLTAAAGANTLPLKEMHFRHAEKLLAMYLRQVEALDKHRGKGQPNVTVGHLHVQQGGQSLVGNVQINPDLSPPDNHLEIDHSAEPASDTAPTTRGRSQRSNG